MDGKRREAADRMVRDFLARVVDLPGAVEPGEQLNAVRGVVFELALAPMTDASAAEAEHLYQECLKGAAQLLAVALVYRKAADEHGRDGQ